MTPIGWRTKSLFVLAVICCLLFAACTHTTAPTKPSELVTLIADPSTAICPATTVPHVFGDRLQPDGTRVPFTIPNGQVLVITSFDWVVEGSTQANNAVWTAITFMGSGKNNALFSGAMTDSIGRAAGTTLVPDGIVVAPGTVLCLDFVAGASAAYGRAHGYLTKNQ